MRTLRAFEALAGRIEGATALDKPADALANLLDKVVRPGPVEDVLSGVPVGHPLHPALVAVPIGAWAAAGVFDALGDDAGARKLIALGCAGFVPAAATGASDYRSVDGAERRVGFVHFVANYAALTAYGLSLAARRRGRRGTGVALSLVGAATLSLGGWLGGHLSYTQGVGVDMTAFQKLPSDWAPLARVEDLPAAEGVLTVADSDGVPVLVTRRGADWVAFADRCTHRGAPLHEGEVVDGCVVCPWHGAEFSLADGSVVSGPATRAQPLLETRVRDGGLEIRPVDERALRANPTGR